MNILNGVQDDNVYTHEHDENTLCHTQNFEYLQLRTEKFLQSFIPYCLVTC